MSPGLLQCTHVVRSAEAYLNVVAIVTLSSFTVTSPPIPSFPTQVRVSEFQPGHPPAGVFVRDRPRSGTQANGTRNRSGAHMMQAHARTQHYARRSFKFAPRSP
mmetsp:Transcript_47718/g.76943  ORF Transcript_47718/g.76943 Transcript_47718/m.76943 type:complete len:104 (+) Transcript_47718:448-759(+)